MEVIDPSNECPVGKTCVWEYTSDFQLKGGGIAKVVGLTGGECTFEQGGNKYTAPCGTRTIISGINPDRIDVLGGAVLGAGAQIGTAFIEADAIKHSAKQRRLASENAAPSMVQILAPTANAGSSSGSFSQPQILNVNDNDPTAVAGAQTDTNVGVGVNSGCTSGKCDSPHD
jgi:hypothetical protein